MKEERIQSLIRQISSGKLSRNKYFSRFRDPEVREARRRSERIQALTELLSEAEPATLSLEKEHASADLWKLACSFPKWAFSWSAYLRKYEVDMLLENGRIREILDSA